MSHVVEAEPAEAELSETGEETTRKTLRLFISDPHHLFRECLAVALKRDKRFDVIDRTASGMALLEKLAQHAADVLVLGADVLDGELIRLTRDISALFPGLRILILGRAESDDPVVDCLLAGAGGFLPRDQSLAEVAAAIEVVARGEKVCPPQVMRLLFARLGELGRERKRRQRLEVLELSAREMEILRLIADGLTNQEIASRLYLSVHTVKNHVHRILDVLGVHSRWGAVNHAFAKGWLADRRRGS
ncbi:MAG TPA: response regulator transcription factor [Thermoanaerobaculia bacterium]|nr:response regulator transcription factor [Thermoanaerobaculia bacterium]